MSPAPSWLLKMVGWRWDLGRGCLSSPGLPLLSQSSLTSKGILNPDVSLLPAAKARQLTVRNGEYNTLKYHYQNKTCKMWRRQPPRVHFLETLKAQKGTTFPHCSHQKSTSLSKTLLPSVVSADLGELFCWQPSSLLLLFKLQTWKSFCFKYKHVCYRVYLF